LSSTVSPRWWPTDRGVAGADVLSVGVLASMSQAQFLAGELTENRRIGVPAVERPDALDVPDGYVGSLGLLALRDAERGRTESEEAYARQALSFACNPTRGRQDRSTARANAGNREVFDEPQRAELAVLRCLATDLSPRKIGAELYVSPHTVETPYPRAVPQARRHIARGHGRASRSARALEQTQSPG
jgi:hypothetical protein